LHLNLITNKKQKSNGLDGSLVLYPSVPALSLLSAFNSLEHFPPSFLINLTRTAQPNNLKNFLSVTFGTPKHPSALPKAPGMLA